jgi:hypothetical protein
MVCVKNNNKINKASLVCSIAKYLEEKYIFWNKIFYLLELIFELGIQKKNLQGFKVKMTH